VARLHALGIRAVAVDNPSVAAAPAGLHADGDNLKAVLDRAGGPVVLVGHSYGGAVITDAGDHPGVEHLVYLSAFALDEGESLVDNQLPGGETMRLGEALTFDEELVHFDESRGVEFFFHDCDAQVASAAVSQLRPMSVGGLAGVPRTIAWRAKPATYVLCTDDRALPVALQQSAAARVGATLEIPTSHSPFLSRPELLAELIAGISRG
jgi:pimeloyl-ACP methyl ester carboxylesterase